MMVTNRAAFGPPAERSIPMGSESHDFLPDDPQPGPSWSRGNWPQVGAGFEDDLTQALDPTAMQAAV
jgi:2-oxoglutarate dehydrogenase E1 component